MTRQGICDHSEPGPTGYGRRVVVGPGERIAVPYVDGATLAVDDCLAAVL